MATTVSALKRLKEQGGITYRDLMKFIRELDSAITVGTCHALVVATYVLATMVIYPSNSTHETTTRDVKHSPIASPVRISLLILYHIETLIDRTNIPKVQTARIT